MNKSTILSETINRIKQNSGMLIFESDINEINWDKDFKDVSKKCINPNELTTYLNKIVTNQSEKPNKREKLGLDRPYIHNKTIPFDEEGEIDVTEFIKRITAMPNNILSIGGNTKIEKSKTEKSMSVNIGIPALRGLVYDIENNEFYIVNTCPGAGSCAMICYARRGSYVMFANVFLNQTKILNLLLNYPDRFEKLLTRELETIALKNPDKEIQFRWNDAGDFFSKKYYDIALRITKNLKNEGYNVKSYAYTKMGDIVNMFDPDFTVNFSNDANKRETDKVKNVQGAKQSIIVPEQLFDDLLEKTKDKKPNYLTDQKGKVIFKKPENVNILKERLALKYNVDVSTILTYDELLSKPVGEPKQYNVVIMPKGDGDIAAQRPDVKISFLCFH